MAAVECASVTVQTCGCAVLIATSDSQQFLGRGTATGKGHQRQQVPQAGGQRQTARVCAAQPAPRLISWRLKPVEALTAVDVSLRELEEIVHRAGAAGCDFLALPEDTLGILHWEVGNKAELKQVLPEAVGRMLRRLRSAAASHRMYFVCSSDVVEQDGSYRNTAFFLGRRISTRSEGATAATSEIRPHTVFSPTRTLPC